MGIRFQCEHCNKRLNVKAHQAGEGCVCPACGRDILVPTSSVESIELRHRAQKTLNSLHVRPDVSASKTLHASKVAVTCEAPRRHAPTSFRVVPTRPSSNSLPASPSLSSQEAFQLGKPETKIETNPLSADTNRVWYLRHRRFGEKGPLRNFEVRELLESNQLLRGFIVWRDDWNDWVSIEQVFPEHFQTLHGPTSDKNKQAEISRRKNASGSVRFANRKVVILSSACAITFLIAAILFYLLTLH